VTDDHDEIEELLAGYVLRSLSGADAAEADRLLSDHVPGCTTCRDTLDDLQRLTADLGLAATPVAPPETLLPRLHRELEPQAPRRRPLQLFAVAAGVVAVVGLAGLTVSQNIRANNADVRADSLANAAQLAALPDARARVARLCELNVAGQVRNVANTTVVRDAWARGQRLAVHGWIYDVADGLLKDLGLCLESPGGAGATPGPRGGQRRRR